MNILFVSSEVVPFAKTGGLADVIGALPEALSKRGHTCSVILPLYKCVKENGFDPALFKEEKDFKFYFLKHGNVNIYFIESDEYYNRDQLYGIPQGDYPDNALRFGFFAKAIVALIPHIGRQDIIHCNDWQTGLVPLYIRLFHKKDSLFSDTKTLFTIHNMAYQGLFGREYMRRLNIPGKLFNMHGLEFYGRMSFLKAGIIYSDAISSVSKGYAREILTKELGCGLDGLLNTRKKALYGIVNGVDYSVWNPETDKFIAKKYSARDMGGKLECKKDVLGEYGIKYDPSRPLIGMITRLAEQKGIDIVADCMDKLLELGIDLALLGFGDEKYNNIFKGLSEKYKGHVGARIGFDNVLAHKIEAGSDMFLMPSRYEPCGLNQLYSMKYATVPVVRAVGGLDDTVEDFDPVTKKGNGFKFQEAYGEALLASMKKAVEVFKNKDLWNTLLQNGLSCDYSWAASAEKYEKLYNEFVKII
ncbi:MAG: glycogen synthase GlgA [Candidatus Omnitrophica bacterium]|nr:glycogen synthase GlgA [Candidatus Omnitrophota bacterium]